MNDLFHPLCFNNVYFGEDVDISISTGIVSRGISTIWFHWLLWVRPVCVYFVFYRRAWGYQMGNQNPYIEEGQTTQWSKETGQKDKQRSTKHTYKTNNRVTRTPLKPERELRCSGRVSSSCSTSGTRRVNLVTNPVISREWGKDQEVFTTSGTYPWSFVTQRFHNGIANIEVHTGTDVLNFLDYTCVHAVVL